jgi:branched-chain amino acid transport system ATP-binding protein
MVASALEVTELVAGYSGKVDVLRGVTLEVGEREAVAILGANGAGKTTLLRSISGLLPARRGRVRVHGEEVSGKAAHRIARSGVAHVPEGRQIFARQTVRENMRLGSMGAPDSGARLAQVLEVFPALDEKLDQPAVELSGGQQQMLAIARGLMSSPSLLLLDEPSLGLSPKLVDEVTALLRRLRAELGIAILLVEQSATVAAGVADRAYVLRMGTVVLEESAADVLGSEDVLSAYLG